MKENSILKPRLLSHCTCEVIDIKRSRRLYEEVLGLEVVEDGPKSLLMRMDSLTVIHVVETDTQNRRNKHGSHMGFDVFTEEEVDRYYKKVLKVKQAYEIAKVGPIRNNHGNYRFNFEDRDGNVWEILDNPEGGYRWRFEQSGDLKLPFLPNMEGVNHWRDVVDPETYRMPTVSRAD